jgi:hypothetical protein
LTPVLVLTPLFLFALTLAFIVRVLWKLHHSSTEDDLHPDWLDGFSVSAYQPMQILFCDDDFAFISRQPGFDFTLYKKFRRDRLRIFRQYMNRLIRDYNRLHEAGRMMVAATSEDQSELMGRLIRLKMKFSVAVLQAEVNYLLCCVGFRTLAARALLARLEELSAQVAAIASISAA